MHLGIDIKSCEELVERGSGSMHHESIVDALMWDVAVLSLDVGILLMDHGRHGETGLLLMDRLADENAGVFRTKVEKKRTAVLHHRNEFLITDPGRVEEDVIAEMADAVNNLACVVNASVIRAKLDDSQADRALSLCLDRILLSDELSDVILIEAVVKDAADGAEGISCRFQINRRCAGNDKSAVIDRLMIVPVEENDVARSEDSIQYNLVGSGSAIQNEVCLVSVVDACRMLLCSESRAFMDEEIAHGNVGVAKISPEGILTEEIIESASGRMLPKESAALMAWAVELGITVFNILLEILEERRKNSVFVMRSSAFYLTVIESMIRIIEIDDAVYLSDDRIIYKASLRFDEEDRDIERKEHLFIEDKTVFISIRHNDRCNVGEISIIDINNVTAFDGTKNFQSFLCISDF